MIKGTTPTIHYDLPFESNRISTAEIVLEYVNANKKVLIVKGLTDCSFGETSIEAVLTQEETLQLPAPSIAHVQLRVVTTDGTVMATEAKAVTIKRLLKDDSIELEEGEA